MYTVVLCKELSFGDFCKLYVGTAEWLTIVTHSKLETCQTHLFIWVTYVTNQTLETSVNQM